MSLIKRVLLPCVAGWCMASLAITAFCADSPHNYAQWEKEISAFERRDRTNPPPKGGVVFTGSSTIRKWTTMARDLPGHQVINRGFGGSEIADATYFAPRIIFPYQPKMVVLRAGGNDLHNGKSVETVFANYKEFVAKVHAALPDAQIVYLALSPSISRWDQHEKEKALNQWVEAYVKDVPYLKYIEAYDVPLGPDGKPRPELFERDNLHFNGAGNKLMAEKVRAFLDQQEK